MSILTPKKFGDDPLDSAEVVFDLDEWQAEPYTVEDVDASVLAEQEFYQVGLPESGNTVRHLSAASLKPRAAAKVLGPLRREIRLGTRGLDVIAVKRALWRAGFYPGKPLAFTPLAGAIFVRQLRKYQRSRRGLSVDGVYGNATHRSLGQFMDAFAIKLYHDAKIGAKGAELKRQKFRSYCLYLYHNRDRVHYSMSSRRMFIIRNGLSPSNVFRYGSITEDCSSVGKGLYKWIGIPDPNGFGYHNPWGYTGTMLQRGIRVLPALSSLRIGDALFTGNFPFVHVWYYIGNGLAFSHGSESGPHIRTWNYRYVSRVQRYIPEK